MHARTHTHQFNGPFSGTTGARKVKAIWILLKQETVSGSGISWAICKSAPWSRQITMPAPHHSVFYMPDALPATQPTVSKQWRQRQLTNCGKRIEMKQSIKTRKQAKFSEFMPHLGNLISLPAGHVIVSIHRNVGNEFVVKSVVTVGRTEPFIKTMLQWQIMWQVTKMPAITYQSLWH